jgi:fatty acid desaturase
MAPFPSKLKDLCSPALFYFVVSIVCLIINGFQNMGNRNVYTMGPMSARVSRTLFVIVVKFVYILFWTWILNLICGSGHPGIAWFLVLIPFILLLAVVLVFMVNPYVLEGLTKKDEVKNPMAPLNRALGSS